MRHGAIGGPHSLVKRERLSLESIPPWLAVLPRQPDRDGQIEQDGHVWLQTDGGEGYHRGELLYFKTSAGALVGEGRIGVAITHHDFAALDRGQDHLRNQLGTRGVHQQGFGARHQAKVIPDQQYFTQVIAEWCATGLVHQ